MVVSKKLIDSKWTAAVPEAREKHFVLTRVIENDHSHPTRVSVELRAVLTGRTRVIPLDALHDRERWKPGWG